MIIKQINKIKVELFEEKELKEKFRLNNDEINLIMEYQRHFPELMQKDNGDKTFCIDGEKLCHDLEVEKFIGHAICQASACAV